jgi:NAD(P)-dependent dehydrogenase (short-subunit alcohol dehydrogenase family)
LIALADKPSLLGRSAAVPEPTHTRINTVSPGLIKRPLWSRMPEKDRAATYASAPKKLPARRVDQSQDIAKAVLFLATTPFATGSNVRVDGGGTIA